MRFALLGKQMMLSAAMALLLGGCGAAQGNNGDSAAAPSAPPSAPPASQDAAGQTDTKPNTSKPSPGAGADTSNAAPAAPEQGSEYAADHIVVVVEENHSYQQIVGNKQAPYFNQLISEGALFTNSFAVAHPSQPNYLALFSGSTQGMKDDSCGKTYSKANLASELIRGSLSFTGYSEDLPKPGFTGCSSKGYARKHNPWVQFTNVPAELNQPLSAFPQDFGKLPAVSFVIPNHQDDMHDGTIEQADTWLKEHLNPYVEWAAKHHSLLIVTWDEDDNSKNNHIPTIFVGPMINPGTYDEKINHYNVLRTIEDVYRLTPIGESANVSPITSMWKRKA